MPENLRKKAIKILRQYHKRAFSNSVTMKGYIIEVTERLNRIGIVGIPKKPENFLKFCRKYGLFIRKEK